MQLDNNQQAFFALIQAGLWEQDVRLAKFGKIDFSVFYHLADEQSIVGLVAAGLEHVVDIRVPKDVNLNFASIVLQLEQRNAAMNSFIREIVDKMRKAEIYTILVKGQGIAQCYERPLWRACGDIDFFLSNDNYNKAKDYLSQLADKVEEEEVALQHLEMTINQWVVELHGTLHGGLTRRINRGLDEIKSDLFYGGKVRSWLNGKTQVFLPCADIDVVIVFSRILQHFFYKGIGLRQVCDWCRLLWTYRETLNLRLLESRIRRMGLMTEWKAFAALAVNDLWMPVEAMPFYSDDRKWSRKSDKIRAIILETGNFGHNRDVSYYQKHSYLVRKTISLWRNTKDNFMHMMIFPADATRVWFYRFWGGIEAALKGK